MMTFISIVVMFTTMTILNYHFLVLIIIVLFTISSITAISVATTVVVTIFVLLSYGDHCYHEYCNDF